MINKEIIDKIIEAGNYAPSGGNSQPWKFRVKNNIIEVITLPEKDHPILNFKNRGTYVAHGALIENMEVIAQSLGYEPAIEIFPNKNISARITLHPLNSISNVELAETVSKRHTNRKPYSTQPLTEEEKSFLLKEANSIPGCEIYCVEGNKIRHAAECAAVDMAVNLQNQLLHRLLFQEVLWKEEEQKHRPGLYIKTMEATPPKSTAMKLLSHWKIAKLFHKMKITQKIYEQSAKTAASAALFGMITTEDSDIGFIQAGRLMEKIWLRATKLDLSFQLIAGYIFLWHQANFGKREIFSENEKQMLNQAYIRLEDIFGIKNKTVALMFRIGKADKALAISHKRPPEIEWN